MQDTNVILYDDAKSHFKDLNKFPQDLPIVQAYVHIGFYMGWVIEKELFSEYFEDESIVQILRFNNRQISCTVLSEIWDGELGSDLFSKIGNEFTEYYYRSGKYLDDYHKVLAEKEQSIYHVDDNWSNYDTVKAVIERRFEKWRSSL